MSNVHVFFVVVEDHVEHLGLMYISSILKQNGFATSLLRADYRTIARELDAERDRRAILCYSPTYFSSKYYLDLNRAIKQKFDIHSVWGGHHVTSTPEIIQEDGVDAICVGEGDYSFLEYVQGVSQRRVVTSTRGLWVKAEGRIYQNAVRQPIFDLDELPFPDRELLKRRQGDFFKRRAYVITSRGCSYSCSHCYNNTSKSLLGYRNPYRRRSVDNVIREIALIKEKQPLEFIIFYDDLFICMPNWLEEFSVKYGQQISVPFRCNGRVEEITPTVLKVLKQAGCQTISFGVEASDNRIREGVLNRAMSTEKIVDAARMIKEAGIVVRTSNMIGLPTGSLRNDLELVRLNVRCQSSFSIATIFTAYPGTDFYAAHPPRDDAEKNGFLQNLLGNPKTPWALFLQKYKAYIPQYGFSSPDERRAIMNLAELFPVLVQFPVLLPCAMLILWLPLRWLYRFIHDKSRYLIGSWVLYANKRKH